MKKWIVRLLALVVVSLAGVCAWAMVTFDGRMHFPDVPKPALKASSDAAVIEAGKYLVHGPAHCAQCHSGADRDHPEQVKDTPLRGGLEFPMGPIATAYAANLTPAGIGARTDEELARAIRNGVLHDGQLSFFMMLAASKPSDEDLVAIISYLRSLAPTPNAVPAGEWKPLGKVMFSFTPLAPAQDPAPKHVPPAAEPSVERGAYLSKHLALCSTCHTSFDMATFKPSGAEASGSLPDRSHGKDSDKEFVAPNLTSGGLTGQMSEDAFIARLRGGRVFASSIMPWETFQNISDADARSIYRYLKSLPPVTNNLGPSYRDVGWKP